jgi:hypothetical protein
MMCEIVIATDSVCKNTKLLFCCESATLFIAGIRILLVGNVVAKIIKARTATDLLILKPSKKITADTVNT